MFTQSKGLDALINRRSESKWQQFLNKPCLFLAKEIYSLCLRDHRAKTGSFISVVCISDTHNRRIDVPDGDVLIHAGDATQSGTLDEFQSTLDWLSTLPHQHKVMIGGNHDMLLDSNLASFNSKACNAICWREIRYLDNEAITLKVKGDREVKIYGSPYTPRHGNWAFQYSRSRDVWENTLPDDLDILVTHGPPKAHLDLWFGCESLLRELWRTKPRLHVFGHIHAAYGQELLEYDGLQKAYEATTTTGGGIWNVFRALYEAVLKKVRPPRKGPSTLLVNAAIVGGYRDEKRRRPVVVHL